MQSKSRGKISTRKDTDSRERGGRVRRSNLVLSEGDGDGDNGGMSRATNSLMLLSRLIERLLAVGLAGMLILFGAALACAGEAPKRARPVRLTHDDASRLLLVGGEGSGELLGIDQAKQEIASRQTVVSSLADFCWSPILRAAFVLDAKAQSLTRWQAASENAVFPLTKSGEWKLPEHPYRIALSEDQQKIAISSLWSRQVLWLDFTNEKELRPSAELKSVKVPFPAGELCWQEGTDQVLVGGAFRGEFAVVSTGMGKVLAQKPFAGHNIRGIVWDKKAKAWLIAHQQLDEKGPITKENIARGSVLTNVLTWMPAAWMFTEVEGTSGTKAKKPRLILANLDSLGNGAADPAHPIALADGNFAVALSGVNEVATVRPTGSVLSRVSVGVHPVDVLEVTPGVLATACHLEDRIDFVSLELGKVTGSVFLSEKRSLTPQEEGERQFYNGNLSHDRWYSCHSCHPGGHTTSLRADTQGDGSFGAPKRTLTLLGTRLTDRWAWNGSMQNLRDQVLKSLDTTMQKEHYTQQQASALVDFLHTLPPPPPLRPAKSLSDAEQKQLERGREVFVAQNCVQCHVPPLTYTSHEAVEVGLVDELGNKKFSPPSLRGVGQGERFLHDGRATTLRSVFEEHAHQLSSPLEEGDLAALLLFLESL